MMYTTPTSTVLFTLFSILPALAHHNLPRHARQHPAQAQAQVQDIRAREVELDERLLPITATTTVVVDVTMTQTVWVMPTDQVAFTPTASASSSSSTETESASASASSSEIESGSSAEASATGSASVSASGSIPGNVVWAPPPSSTSTLESSTDSAAASPTAVSDAAAASSSTFSSDASLTASDASSTSNVGSSTSQASGSGPSPSATASLTESSTESDATSLATAAITSSASPSASTSNAPSPYAGSSGSVDPSASTTASSSSASSHHKSSGSSDAGPSVTASSSTISSSAVSSEASESSSSTTSSDWASVTSSIITSVTEAAVSSSSSAISSSASKSASSTSSATSSASSSSSTLAALGATLMNAYYPDWAGSYLAPASVDWSRFDVVDFAFALPTADGNLQFTQDDSSELLTELVAAGHANGKRVKLSIGGWTGSAYFSTITGDNSLRSTFVSNILKAYNAYNLDGIDIDWEYPGTSGASGNAVSSDDSANFLLFLQDLRAALPSDALISTATQVWPFAGPDGQPLSDVSAFAQVIDWILIMNYDIWGSSSTPGPNAPLSDACNNSTQPLANAYAAVSSWTTAGMPANKITLGVPAYGYLQKSKASSLVQRRSFPTPVHKRNTADTRRAKGYTTVYNDGGGDEDGQVMFESLISQGALVANGDGGFDGANGFERYWDSCSSTPWIKSTDSGQIITYDDPESMSLKGQFAAQAGLRGCNVFSIDGDWTGSSWPLTDAVRSGLGL